MTAESAPRGRRLPHARHHPDGDLARDLTIAHAKARAAWHLLTQDPVAAARALHDITRHTGAALEALAHRRSEGVPNAVEPAARLAELLTGFRAGGGALRISVVGAEQPLDPAGELTVRQLAAEALETAATYLPGADLSFSLTWSPEHLDVRVVGGATPGRPPGPDVLPAPAFERSRAGAASLAGALRVTAPPGGGFVAVIRLPVGQTPQPAACPVAGPVGATMLR